MSSEGEFARRLARCYGPEVCALDRPQRIAWLQAQVAAAEEIEKTERASLRKAQRAACKRCTDGNCFECQFRSLSLTDEMVERHARVRFYNNAIAIEQRDTIYAQTARDRGVVYEHHIDGFCAYWQNLRQRRFEIAGRKCERCGELKALEAHHLHYDTLGFEELLDIEALCRGCHRQHRY